MKYDEITWTANRTSDGFETYSYNEDGFECLVWRRVSSVYPEGLWYNGIFSPEEQDRDPRVLFGDGPFNTFEKAARSCFKKMKSAKRTYGKRRG